MSPNTALAIDTAPVAAPKPADQPTHANFTGSIPATYDRDLGPLLFKFSAADLANRVAAARPDAERVLEVACGTGISTEYLWRALAPRAEITATDLNEAMLEYAREHRGRLANVTYTQADAQDLPFDDDSFDVVVCQFGIMFFPEKARAFSEFARVLKPGGLLAFNVWDSLDHNTVAKIAQQTIASFFETDAPDFLTVPFGFHAEQPIRDLIDGADLALSDSHLVSATVERPDARSVARGFVEGNPGILQIHERATAEPDDIVDAAATAIEAAFGPSPLSIPLQEKVFLATKA